MLVHKDFTVFQGPEGTKIAGSGPILALDSPLGGQEDCGKGPSCMGEGGRASQYCPLSKKSKRWVLGNLSFSQVVEI